MIKKFFLTLVLVVCMVSVAISSAIALELAGEHVLPDSNNRIIFEHELLQLSPWELKVAKNEIYARHGKKFEAFDLRCYFANKSWYKINHNYSDNLLNTFEKKNLSTLKKYESQHMNKSANTDMGCTFGRDKALRNNYAGSYYLFVIPDSNRRYVNDKELKPLNTWELKVARNEIYARHGKKFESQDLSCYFKNKNWYQINPNYTDYLLNTFEIRNIEQIKLYEKKIGSKVANIDKGCQYGRNKALE